MDIPVTNWDQVCEILKYHREKISCVEKINRIWIKSPLLGNLDELPYLMQNNTHLFTETWRFEKVLKLIEHPKLKTSLEPRSLEGAIVVVRWKGNDYLMDGKRRINYWNRKKGKELMEVIIIAHKE